MLTRKKRSKLVCWKILHGYRKFKLLLFGRIKALVNLIGAVQQFRSTTVPKIEILFNIAENQNVQQCQK